MPEQGNKYNIAHLKVSLQVFFFSSLGKKTARWMLFLHPSVCPSFAVGILWKIQLWDIFARIRTAKCIVRCNHNGSLEDDYCIPFFKLKFLISALRHIFFSPKPSKIYRESSVSRNRLGKYTFLWFKKETFISNGRTM